MQRQDVPDDAKLYVSNLPSSMTNDLLRSVFTPFGEVRPGRCKDDVKATQMMWRP